MLLLARKAGQSVVIDGNIRVTVDRIRGRVVRLKVEAPTEIRVDREEVWNRVSRSRVTTQHVLPRRRVIPMLNRVHGNKQCDKSFQRGDHRSVAQLGVPPGSQPNSIGLRDRQGSNL